MKDKIQQIIISAQLGGISSIEATQQVLDLFAVSGRSEQLVAFLKWVGDGYDFENNAEKIVKEYISEGN
jgi:hypothetical protein